MGRVALLTGGSDLHYAGAIASSAAARGVTFDFIGSDELDVPRVREVPRLRFLNLRGDQSSDAALPRKVVRILAYYWRLIAYAATARPRVFHILWNNKFELFDRTLLLLYYRLLGKRLVLTVHNVNSGARDGSDGLLNRASLKAQYRLAHHLFVHTDLMRAQLESEFGVPTRKITVIPYGINSAVPDTELTPTKARSRLGLDAGHKVLLFFGNIAPYKGLEYLVRATAILATSYPECRLIIAGRPRGEDSYWPSITAEIRRLGLDDRTVRRIAFIPDEEIEVYFKAADVLVLPYTHIFQSGVLFLGYNYGLPAIVSDVGALRSSVIEGTTGFVCRPQDAEHLARTADCYFRSALYANLESRRPGIQRLMAERHGWDTVADLTCRVYDTLEKRR